MRNNTRSQGLLPAAQSPDSIPTARPFNFSTLPLFLFFLTPFAFASAQTGCPGCAVGLPTGLATDTVYLQPIPDGEQNLAYDADISFRMPKTTTPVAAIDSVTPPGLTISKIEIVGVDNLPPGLKWQPSQTIFQTASQTDGCIKICGKPLVPDTFILLVKLKATVLFITQETSFPMRFVVHPATSATDGFSMTNVEGCGEVTTSFVNNVPSGGQPSFSYSWDFGDGSTFAGENPPPHTFDAPGVYPVHYQAVVDTAGFILESFTVLAVECVDQLGAGAPDLYAYVDGPNGGAHLFNSQPDVNNATLPLTIPVGLKLDPTSNYTLSVWDEDSGLKGSDDACGSISFNFLSNDTLTSGGFKVALNIVHPVDTVRSTDTVTVYPQPAPPTVAAPDGLEACVGGSVVLGSNYGAGNQWFKNAASIPNATEFTYTATQPGFFQVRVTNTFGCTAISDSVEVVFHPLPLVPYFNNNNNRLTVADTNQLPPTYGLQWYNLAAPIPGETGLTYCVQQTSTYGLEVTDLATGCKNFFQAPIVFNPSFDCTVGSWEVRVGRISVFPNPATDAVVVQFDSPILANGRLRVFDLTGKTLLEMAVGAGSERATFDCAQLPAGVFSLEFSEENGLRQVGKLVVAGR